LDQGFIPKTLVIQISHFKPFSNLSTRYPQGYNNFNNLYNINFAQNKKYFSNI